MPERRFARPSPIDRGPETPEGTLDQSRILDRVSPYPVYPSSGVGIIDAIAALDPPAADNYVYFTSATAGALATITSFGRNLLTSQGQIGRAVRRVTAAGDVTVDADTDDIIVIDKSTPAATAVNFPATPATGLNITVKDGGNNCSTYNITLTPNAENIEGAATYVMNVDSQSVEVVYDGSEYKII